jgi:hypothetical protein
MKLNYFEHDSHPGRIAISKTEHIVEDGLFFLDFTRPLIKFRKFIFINKWLGPVIAIHVPIIHQGEASKDAAFIVYADPAYEGFYELIKLWKENYPAYSSDPKEHADGIKIAADFGAQFPEDARVS